MNLKFLKITLLFCLSCTVLMAQNKPKQKAEKKPGMLTIGINYSDYGFVKAVKDSSISAAFNRKGLFQSGNSSFGFGIGYWKTLGSHVNFSGNFAGTFSNFPKLFVKEDSIGKASFTPQIDLLLHFMALKNQSKINPFLTGGIGGGYFGKQLAVYAPVGAGLQFRFNRTYLFVQAQWRMALTDGITEDYTFYSIGLAQTKLKKTEKKPAETAPIPPAVDSAKKEVVPSEPDADGDGVPDIRDNCPTEKGTLMGCPDSDGDGVADKDDQCPDVKGDPRYKGCPVPDTDGDGVNDDDDKCKTVFGLRENNGCPPEKDPNGDDDGDGILNKDDKCPDKAGSGENDGCPMEIVKGGQLLRVSGDSMTYYIRFDFDKANITNEAFAALGEVVKILKADKTLNIKIDGHADSFGQEVYNMQISKERSNVARDYLMSYGIAKGRIATAWFGSSVPYDVHQDWLNRRVEITLYKKK